jgi:lysophospholipase L1-like esterase
MHNPMRLPRLLAAATLAALGLAAAAPAQTTSTVNFGTYVAFGDSLTAGYMSSSLVETRQKNSFPAQIGRQAKLRDFQQPLVGEPGIPPELVLVTLLPSPVIAPKATTPGVPKNLALATPYHNLGVPGATLSDFLLRTTDAGGFHDLILRGKGTAIAQGISLRPDFVTLWIGNNDVLAAAVRGSAVDGVTLTPAPVFRQLYSQAVSTIKASTAAALILAANLPDVTRIPFVTTVKPYVVNPTTGQPVLVNGQTVPLLGPTGPLPSNAYVTLAGSSLIAKGIGIPISAGGTGQPLPGDVILDPSEVSIIQARVTDNNRAIQDICAAASITVVDVNALMTEFATTGRSYGGVSLTSDFLTGGIFSYDGVHPTEVGYGLVANEFIKAIRAKGGTLEDIDIGALLGVHAQSAAKRPAPIEFSEEAWEDLLAVFPRVDGR